MSQDKQLIPISESLPAELQAEMEADAKESLNEMMAGVDARPPQIKISPGGSNLWLFGDDDPVKTFRGVILANSKANAYWHQEDNIANPILLDLPEDHNYDFPLCASLDGATGSRPAEPSSADGEGVSCFGRCTDCFLNQFGTARTDNGAKGRGKACKNGRRMVVWVDGHQIPFLMTLPPTSILAFDSYVTMLRGKGIPLWAVWTVFELESKQRAQQKWSQFHPGAFERVSEDDLPGIYTVRKDFRGIVTTEITTDDFEENKPQDAEFVVEDE